MQRSLERSGAVQDAAAVKDLRDDIRRWIGDPDPHREIGQADWRRFPVEDLEPVLDLVRALRDLSDLEIELGSFRAGLARGADVRDVDHAARGLVEAVMPEQRAVGDVDVAVHVRQTERARAGGVQKILEPQRNPRIGRQGETALDPRDARERRRQPVQWIEERVPRWIGLLANVA